jgi:hypothetical protein
MLMHMKRAYFSIVVCALALCIGTAQQLPVSDAALKVLVDADFGTVYADDGAGDGTVTYKGELIGSGPNVKPDPRVKAVVDLKSAAIPLLITHLDDPRPTRIRFQGKPVPLGHVALDILTHVIGETNTVFVQDCADDGLGACIQPAYYFRPDASLQQMKAVKQSWQKLNDVNGLVFQYPSWWR